MKRRGDEDDPLPPFTCRDRFHLDSFVASARHFLCEENARTCKTGDALLICLRCHAPSADALFLTGEDHRWRGAPSCELDTLEHAIQSLLRKQTIGSDPGGQDYD